MSFLFKCRQVDKYDGQSIYTGGKIVYDLGNYLGGGASGSVYQGFDPALQGTEKSVAIKILNPLGYKNLVLGNINQHSVALKGVQLSSEQASGKIPITSENVWWLLHNSTKSIFAAFEDPHRKQLRELPLTKCVEIWGTNPLNFERINEAELEKINNSGNVVTVDGKEYKIPLVSPKYLKFLRNRLHVCREMNNMVQIGEHPNIVELLEVLELIQDSKTTLFLVLELINGGELFDRVKAGATGGNVEEFARRYINQLLSGLEYCHKRGIVHRDLKPENLLLSDPTDTAILKIADFGLSAVIFAAESNDGDVDGRQGHSGQLSPGSKVVKSESRNPQFRLQNTNATSIFSTPLPKSNGINLGDVAPASFRRLRSVVGSPHYIAPEIASDDPAGYDGRKVDMWSTGVILYSLFTGSLPFGSDLVSCSRFRRYKQWLNTDYIAAARDGKEPVLPSWFWPSNISPLVSSLLVGLLQCDPSCRLSAAEAIRHPWCQNISVEEYKSLQSRESNGGARFPVTQSAEIFPSIRNPNSTSTVNRLAPCMEGRECTPDRSRSENKNRSITVISLPLSPSAAGTVGKMDGSSSFQYDWAMIQEQQRKKEAEALEIYGRQVTNIKLSNEDSSVNRRPNVCIQNGDHILEMDHQQNTQS